jgi:hypothetical protein
MNKIQSKILAVLVFIYAFVFCFAAANAQDGVQIPLQEFTLQIPTVNKLVVKPLGAPRMDYIGSDTVSKALVQDVYYQLLRADGRSVEHGNKTIPMQMYNIIYRYVQGNVTASDVTTINYFFQAADWPLTAVMPED